MEQNFNYQSDQEMRGRKRKNKKWAETGVLVWKSGVWNWQSQSPISHGDRRHTTHQPTNYNLN